MELITNRGGAQQWAPVIQMNSLTYKILRRLAIVLAIVIVAGLSGVIGELYCLLYLQIPLWHGEPKPGVMDALFLGCLVTADCGAIVGLSYHLEALAKGEKS